MLSLYYGLGALLGSGNTEVIKADTAPHIWFLFTTLPLSLSPLPCLCPPYSIRLQPQIPPKDQVDNINEEDNMDWEDRGEWETSCPSNRDNRNSAPAGIWEQSCHVFWLWEQNPTEYPKQQFTKRDLRANAEKSITRYPVKCKAMPVQFPLHRARGGIVSGQRSWKTGIPELDTRQSPEQ